MHLFPELTLKVQKLLFKFFPVNALFCPPSFYYVLLQSRWQKLKNKITLISKKERTIKWHYWEREREIGGGGNEGSHLKWLCQIFIFRNAVRGVINSLSLTLSPSSLPCDDTIPSFLRLEFRVDFNDYPFSFSLLLAGFKDLSIYFGANFWFEDGLCVI